MATVIVDGACRRTPRTAMLTQLTHQRLLLESWLQTPAALSAARRFVHRRGLNRSAEELVSETWLRLGRTIAGRSEPYPDMDSTDSARRYVSRIMDNLSRDMARSIARRNEYQLQDDIEGVDAEQSRVEGQLVLLQLVDAIGRRADAGLDCPGCREELVLAAGLELLTVLMQDEDGGDSGQTVMDRLLYEALDRAGGQVLSPAARRQRKARYGPYVVRLLQDALQDVGLSV